MIVKFTGPNDKIKLNFRKLPTPLVEWEGTAKELHDLLMKAWYESEPESLVGAAQPGDDKPGGAEPSENRK